MSRLKACSQDLAAEKAKVVMDREHLDSAWRLLSAESLTLPVAIRQAAFCAVCSFDMFEMCTGTR